MKKDDECPDKKMSDESTPPTVEGEEGEGNLGAKMTDEKKEDKKDEEDKKAAPSFANRPMKAPFKDWSESQWREYVKSTGHTIEEDKKAGVGERLVQPDSRGTQSSTPPGGWKADSPGLGAHLGKQMEAGNHNTVKGVFGPPPAKKAEHEIRPGHPADGQKKVASAMRRDGEFNPERHGGPFNPQTR